MATIVPFISLPTSHYQADDYVIRIVSNHEEMEKLRTLSEELNWHPNTQMDHFHLVNEAWKSFTKPVLLVLERGGDLQGLLVGRIVTRNYYCHLGYKRISLGQARQLEILYGGILGCDEPEKADAMYRGLKQLLNSHEADLVFFNHLKTESHFFRLVTRSPNFLNRDHLITSQLHWKTTLTATATEFLQRLSKKHRYWLKRMEKLVEKDFPGSVRIQSFSNNERLDTMLQDVGCVARKSYQQRLSGSVLSDESQHQLFNLTAKKGWLRTYVLYLEGQPRAYWVGRIYKGVFYSDATGYDPEYRKYELGSVVFMKMVEQLCEEGVKVIDFGLGDAFYKRRFGNQSWNEASVTVFANSAHGIMLNFARTVLEGPTLGLRWFIRRLNLEQRVKTFWRRRLVKGEEQ